MTREEANARISTLVDEIKARIAEIETLATEHNLDAYIPFQSETYAGRIVGGAELETRTRYREYEDENGEWQESETEYKTWAPAGGWYSSSYEC